MTTKPYLPYRPYIYAVTVDGEGQTGSSIRLAGAGAVAIPDYFKKGFAIQFGGVYDINPLTWKTTGWLKNFEVTADTPSVAETGAVMVPIHPAIITSGPYQNCSASPPHRAAVTSIRLVWW